ncbi:LuxR family transcriptional regulator [Microbacterium sp. G2-8]|uniref:response regulator transcription factor n=1 Tax=Microbacterium sp. G2-8 TaxID=2842454 RepID=UPI001C88E435|nr:helix-turn-helix transcriptional regulator [Microbacterium sp. G2-8]
MNGSGLSQAGPLPTERVRKLARSWAKQGALVLAGAAGSGRRTTADELVAARVPTVETWHLECGAETKTPYAVVDLLGLLDDVASDAPLDAVAEAIASRHPSATILVEHAEHADPSSLRTLSLLARRTRGIRVLLTIDAEHVRLRSLRQVHGMPVESIEPLDREQTLDVVERMVGARPTYVDAHLLQELSTGSFRGIRWLVELAQLHHRITLDHGRARVLLPHLTEAEPVPEWSLRPDLIQDPALQRISLVSELPVAHLDELGIADRCAELEREGLVRLSGSRVVCSMPAMAYDISARIGPLTRRSLLHELLEVLPPHSLTDAAATVLCRHAAAAGIEHADWLMSRALADASRRGLHDDAIVIGDKLTQIDDDVLPDLVFSSVIADDAVAFEKRRPHIAAASDTATEAVGIALAIGELRRGPASLHAQALDDLVLAASGRPATAAVLTGYRALVRPGIELDEEEMTQLVGDDEVDLGTRARALRALAMRAWMDGRPVAAREMIDRADALDRGYAVDGAVSLFLRVASELLRPDADACADELFRDVAPGDASRLRALLGAALGFYTAAVPVSRMHLRRLLPNGDLHDPALEPLTLAMMAIAHSMLADEPGALAALDAAADAESASGFVSAGAHHLHGVAVTHLPTNPQRDEGLACYAAAAEAADELDFRFLAAVATYRRALESAESRRASILKSLSKMRHGDRPLDGLPGLFADMADALDSHDVRALVGMAERLRSAGLLHEARVHAIHLASSAVLDLPDRVRRGVSRIARHRLHEPAAADPSLLTPREKDVARLVLDELTDREIADRLHLSPRTVNVHVGRILRKLDITGRRALTPELARRSGVVIDDPS